MKALLFSFFIACPVYVYSQWTPDKLTTSPLLNPKDNNKIIVETDAVGFFKNNEYFSPIAKGETFPGIYIRTGLSYQIDTKLRLKLGANGLYYSGDQYKNGVYIFNGIFAGLQYTVDANLNLILGNYYGGVNHRLIEPLYRWEKHLTEKPESGLQVMYENERCFADVWLNWQRFIQKGDSVPEVLTFGLSSSFMLSRPNKRLKISVPLQMVIHHQGGQIDVSEEKMIVSGNLATGICSEYGVGNRFIKSVGMNLYLAGYYDKLPDNSVRPYNKGWAVYPVLTVNASPFKFMAGYWHAKKFYSFDGEPLFASFNPEYPDKVLPQRQLLTTKFSYSKQLHEKFAIGGQIETYSDLKRGKTDYSFGIYLRFSSHIFTR